MASEAPSAILSAAAVRVRDLAAAATPGPWFTHDTHLRQGGHTATILSGTYPEGQLRAWLPTWSHEPWDEKRNVWNDARWIAALSPVIAEPLAEALDVAAGTAREMEEDGREVNPSWAMLDLARALVGSGSEENTHG